MLTPDLSLWWPVISQARWFSGKGRDGRLVSIDPLPWLVHPPSAVLVRPELAQVAYPDGTAETYQLLVSYRQLDAEPGAADIGTVEDWRVGDAPRDPEAMAAVSDVIRQPARIDGGRIVVQEVSSLTGPDLTPRWYPGQQSNTNVFLGSVALLKIFRRLEPGPNLDVELTTRLRELGVDVVPKVFGWVEAHLDDGRRYDLASLTEQLQQPEDGWQLACDSCAAGTDFSVDAAALGDALRAVHEGLSTPTTVVSGDEISSAMARRLDSARHEIGVLEPYAPALQSIFDRLRGRELPAQSIHGDFHLGQTLRTEVGWRIIDFEGEPLKSMAERRNPDSVWRDVAGMMRSFSYATSASTDPTGSAATAWLTRQREAFLGAYCGDVRTVEPDDVLAAYEADKAVYELMYEMRNRPDWAEIPLGALRFLADNERGTSR